MHPNHQDLFIIGSIEYADVPALRQPIGGAPEKIMFQFVGARLFEAENLAALRIDPGHHMPNRAVLAAGVHTLKNQQQRIAVRRIVKALQRAQLRNVFFQDFLIFLLRAAKRLHHRWPVFELHLLRGRYAEILRFDFHIRPLRCVTPWLPAGLRLLPPARNPARPGAPRLSGCRPFRSRHRSGQVSRCRRVGRCR